MEHKEAVGLHPQVVRNMVQSEIEGGVWMKDVPVGGTLLIQTRNTLYQLERRSEDGWFLSGNLRYCPQPTKVSVHGSTWGGSMLKMKYIGRGMHMEFSTDLHHGITTTEISEIRER